MDIEKVIEEFENKFTPPKDKEYILSSKRFIQDISIWLRQALAEVKREEVKDIILNVLPNRERFDELKKGHCKLSNDIRQIEINKTDENRYESEKAQHILRERLSYLDAVIGHFDKLNIFLHQKLEELK